jgi:hypothetical protein
MTKRFRPWDPKQKWLLPPEITEFIPEASTLGRFDPPLLSRTDPGIEHDLFVTVAA